MHPFTVDGMGCNSCVRKITQAMQARDTDASVEIKLNSKQVRVASEMPESDVSRIIMDLGHHPQTEA